MSPSFKNRSLIEVRAAIFAVALILQAAWGAPSSYASGRSADGLEPLFPSSHGEFYNAMRAAAEKNRLRLGAQTPMPCGPARNDTRFMYFCEYEVFRVRVGAWSSGPSDPVLFVTARPFFHASPSDLVLAISLIIAVTEEAMSNSDIQRVAETLVSAGRSLDGTSTFDGKNGRFVARLSKGGFALLASGLNKPRP